MGYYDDDSAKDSLNFIIGWLDRFPRYKNREVYLTGESYAGHYVPQLAKAIITYNANSKHPINLKGIMVCYIYRFIHFVRVSQRTRAKLNFPIIMN